MCNHFWNACCRGWALGLAACVVVASWGAEFAAAQPVVRADVVIYGGSSSGIVAAIQAARMQRSVVLIEPSQHLGGLTVNGLGFTDTGNKAVIGGLSREFYQRIKRHYDQASAWRHQRRDDYARYRADDDAMWTFEPHVAAGVYQDWLQEFEIRVITGERLQRDEDPAGESVQWAPGGGRRLASIRMESGLVVEGLMFIDATYEGDLLAEAGVSYTIGRESNQKYGERLNGVQRDENVHQHRFVVDVDPYQKPGDPASGLLPDIAAPPYPRDGEGDRRIQAYCYRMCMTQTPGNRAPFAKPVGYREADYELLFRNFEAGDLRIPFSPGDLPNGKTDTNNRGAVSTDYIGHSDKYPEASYAKRQEILAEHRRYQQGLMWTLCHHARVPESVRAHMSRWGLAKDEFGDNGHWPRQIYVREARRMVADYVMTELDCRRTRDTPMSVGMGSYNMDSHNCMRFVDDQGRVQNEGDVQVSPGGPYQISYRAIIPARGEAENLLVPVCLSSSHIAYGSIRMEPVFMVLGQSAATAACLAIERNESVQQLPFEKLRERLLADEQVLDYARPPRRPVTKVNPKKLPGVVVDDRQAQLRGAWTPSTSSTIYVGNNYMHDGSADTDNCTAEFRASLPRGGRYEVRIAYPAHANRGAQVPIEISTDDAVVKQKIDQRKKPPIDGLWLSLGTFRLAAGDNTVTVSNRQVQGYVVIDAVQWLPIDE